MENVFSFHGDQPIGSARKISILEYLYVLMLMLYAGRATTFFESPSMTENPIGVILPVAFSALMALKWKIVINKQFYGLLFFFFIYFLAVSIKYYVVQPTFILTYYFLFFIVYVAIRSLKFNLFLIYVKILYWFAIISLILWSAQVALGGDTLFNIFARSSYLESISFVSGEGINAFFYSIQPYATTLINEHTIARNCGFAWEPGSYAVYLCLGIFIDLFMTPSEQKSKRRIIVLFLALVSTLSTTGYVILAFIMVFYLLNKDFKRILLVLPVAVIALIMVFSLPFMKDKILTLFNETSGIDEIVFTSFAREEPVTPQRFSSLVITLIDFRDNPLLGLAAHYEDSWTYKIGSRISPISGIGNLLAQFGIVGFLFFIILSVRSSVQFARYFEYRGKILLFIIIMGISISYTILFIPLIMCFWMFFFFEPDILPQKEEIKSSLNGAEEPA